MRSGCEKERLLDAQVFDWRICCIISHASPSLHLLSGMGGGGMSGGGMGMKGGGMGGGMGGMKGGGMGGG